MTTEMTPEIQEETRACMERWAQEWGAEMNRLLTADPSLGITATVIASDNISARQMGEAVKRGELEPEKAVWMVGSYARLDWAIEHLPEERLLDLLPDLWTGSDPDDTRPEYLALWQRAFARNDQRIIVDGEPLKLQPRQRVIRAFRGQMPEDPLGIAWSLSRSVALTFAQGAGMRRPMAGAVRAARIPVNAVLAYLTGRGEEEVIVDLGRAALGR